MLVVTLNLQQHLQHSRNFLGSIVAEALATFDIADNELDNFTGDGTTTDFTLSRTVPTMLVL